MLRRSRAAAHATAPLPACDKELYRQVIGHFATGVAVITTRTRERRFGMTASAVTSLSLEPPMLLLYINRRPPTCAAVGDSRLFGVSILTEDQGEIAERFAELEVDELAAELRTQPWHVYHALTRLTAEGIVVRDPDVGYAIAPVDNRARGAAPRPSRARGGVRAPRRRAGEGHPGQAHGTREAHAPSRVRAGARPPTSRRPGETRE